MTDFQLGVIVGAVVGSLTASTLGNWTYAALVTWWRKCKAVSP